MSGWPQPRAPCSLASLGRAVQVDPIKPTLKAPETKRLNLKYGERLSSFAFNSILRRYNWVGRVCWGIFRRGPRDRPGSHPIAR